MASRRRVRSTTAARACAALTRCSRSPPGAATCSWLAFARVRPTPPGVPLTSCARRSAGSDTRERAASPPPCRDRERDPRSQVRGGLEPPAIGPLRCQRRLARGRGHRPQPRPLDGPARPGRRDRHDEDPLASVVQPRRAAHPLGSPADAASPGALALGAGLDHRPGATPGDVAPRLTVSRSSRPLGVAGRLPRSPLSGPRSTS